MQFNTDIIRKRLDRLSDLQLLGFSIALAKRLLPNYRLFSRLEGFGDVTVLEKCIEYSMDGMLGRPVSGIASLRERLLEIGPDSEDFGSVEAGFALRACAACDDLLDFLQGGDRMALLRVFDLMEEDLQIYASAFHDDNPNVAVEDTDFGSAELAFEMDLLDRIEYAPTPLWQQAVSHSDYLSCLFGRT